MINAEQNICSNPGTCFAHFSLSTLPHGGSQQFLQLKSRPKVITTATVQNLNSMCGAAWYKITVDSESHARKVGQTRKGPQVK